MKVITYLSSSYLPLLGGLQYELVWRLEAIDDLLSNGLDKNYKFYFLAPNDKALEFAEFKNIEVINLNLQLDSKVNLLKCVFKIRNILNRIKPDLVHCEAVSPDAYMIFLSNLLFFTSFKYLVTSHGSDIVMIPEANYGCSLNFFQKMLFKAILARTKLHLLPSTALINFAIERGTDRKKIKVLPNGVKHIHYKENQETIQTLKKRWNIKDGDFCLLCLSSTRAIKNLERFIQGFILAYQNNDRLKLICTCKHDSNFTAIKELVDNAGLSSSVLFTGPIRGKEKDAFFSFCDGFCLPSVFENCPISIMEAMDYGLAILASKVGGIPDLITDRENGLFFNYAAPKDIAEKIIEVSTNHTLRNKIRANAKKDANLYDIKEIVKRLLSAYETIED